MKTENNWDSPKVIIIPFFLISNPLSHVSLNFVNHNSQKKNKILFVRIGFHTFSQCLTYYVETKYIIDGLLRLGLQVYNNYKAPSTTI